MTMQPLPAGKFTPERPGIVKGYGIRRDSQGLLSWEWVSERMARSHNYWICSTRPDGRPHAMPVWGVWLDDTLYFSTDRGSVKGRNLAAAPRVAVHLESGDEAVMIESIVEEVRDIETLTHIAQVYSKKYSGMPAEPDLNPNVVTFAVRPRRVLAWREKDYPESATRFRMEPE